MKKILTILMAGLAATFLAAAGAAGQDSGMDIHGFISQGYLSSAENYFTDVGEGDDFVFNEVGINFGRELTDELRMGLQLFSRDFGEASGNEIKIDWAIADYRFQDWLGLRFGQMKMPHGLYNEIRDIDMLRNPIILPESVYQELTHDLYTHDVFFTLIGMNSRDLFLSLQGLGIYGFLDLSALGGVSYQIMYGTQKIEAGEPRTYEKADTQIFNFLENGAMDVDYKYAGDAVWETPIEGLRLGVSMNNIKMTASASINENGSLIGIGAAGAEVTADYSKLENWIASAEFTWDNLLLMAEYMFTNKECEINLPDRSKTIESQPTGWYIGAAFRFTDWLEAGGYYSKSEYDNDDYYTNLEAGDFIPHPEFFHEFEDMVATVRIDINPYWVLKLEAHSVSTQYAGLDTSDGIISYPKVEEDWNIYIAKMTVAF